MKHEQQKRKSMKKKIDSLKEVIAISLTLPKKTPLQLKIDVVIPSCSVRLLSKCCQTPQNHEHKIKLGAQLSSYRNHLENELHPCLTRIQGSETIRTFCYFTFENYSQTNFSVLLFIECVNLTKMLGKTTSRLAYCFLWTAVKVD